MYPSENRPKLIRNLYASFIVGNGSNSPVQNSTRSISPNITTSNNNNGHIQSVSPQTTQLQASPQQHPTHHLLNNSVNLGNITPTFNSQQQVMKTIAYK
jgi:hypothetical protein